MRKLKVLSAVNFNDDVMFDEEKMEKQGAALFAIHAGAFDKGRPCRPSTPLAVGQQLFIEYCKILREQIKFKELCDQKTKEFNFHQEHFITH